MKSISVNCPDGWFHNDGYCLKALKEVQKFDQIAAKTKCEDMGGFIFTPMNEKYTEDLEALLLSNQEFKGTDFWIGKKQQCL